MENKVLQVIKVLVVLVNKVQQVIKENKEL